MDKKDLLNAIGEVDQELVEAAAPKGSGCRWARRWIPAAVAAACLLLGVLAISGGWFRREKMPEGTVMVSDTSINDEADKETMAEAKVTVPIPAPSESRTSAETQAPTETWVIAESQAPVILYQKGGITVQEKSGARGNRMHMEACLAYMTEQELFTQPLVMRAVLTEYQALEIIQDYPTFSGAQIIAAALLTFKPVSIIHGTLPEGQETVKVFANYYTNTSLESLSLSLREAGEGREGIIMLHPMDEWDPDYMTQLAEYVPGDNQRFAIWAATGGGLSYDGTAYPGLDKSWTLDRAEAYARQLIGDKTEAPADFTFSFSYENYGPTAEYTYKRSFDSASGLYSAKGTAYMEKEYGAENLETRVRVRKELRDQIYRCLLRLQEMPEMLSQGDNAGGSETTRIEISWFAEGQSHRVCYSGSDTGLSRSEVNRLTMTLFEVEQYLEQSADMQRWRDEIGAIGSEKRQARSEEIVAALKAAFAEQYGPGGAPDFFRSVEISEGGFLEIWLDPCTAENIEEIQNLLPDDYTEYGFAWGSGPEDREQTLYDPRMTLSLSSLLGEREPRWQTIQEETFLQEAKAKCLKLGYVYEDGSRSAWYSFLFKEEEEEWTPFASLRMVIRGSEKEVESGFIIGRTDLEYAWYLAVCRTFRTIKEEERRAQGKPLAWIYVEKETAAPVQGIFILMEDGSLLHSSGTYPEKPLPGDPSVDTITYPWKLSEEDMLHLLAIGLWYAEDRGEQTELESAGLKWK